MQDCFQGTVLKGLNIGWPQAVIECSRWCVGTAPRGHTYAVQTQWEGGSSKKVPKVQSLCTVWTRGGSNTFNLLGIPNIFKYFNLTSNTKYFQSFCIWPQIPNTQSCQILFQILVKYFFWKKIYHFPPCALSYLYYPENHVWKASKEVNMQKLAPLSSMIQDA